jgi:hypothetical protein
MQELLVQEALRRMVREVRIMTTEVITAAQDYLTVINGNYARRILNIRLLLANHSTEAVIGFMKSLLREKEKMLRQYILRDKSNPLVDELVATMWRIYMCVHVLEEEVRRNHGLEQGTAEGGELSHGDCSGHSSSR